MSFLYKLEKLHINYYKIVRIFKNDFIILDKYWQINIILGVGKMDMF